MSCNTSIWKTNFIQFCVQRLREFYYFDLFFLELPLENSHTTSGQRIQIFIAFYLVSKSLDYRIDLIVHITLALISIMYKFKTFLNHTFSWQGWPKWVYFFQRHVLPYKGTYLFSMDIGQCVIGRLVQKLSTDNIRTLLFVCALKSLSFLAQSWWKGFL